MSMGNASNWTPKNVWQMFKAIKRASELKKAEKEEGARQSCCRGGDDQCNKYSVIYH